MNSICHYSHFKRILREFGDSPSIILACFFLLYNYYYNFGHHPNLSFQTALCVEVAGGTESSLTITFLPYEHGDAPVRVDNICEDVFVKLHQKYVIY